MAFSVLTLLVLAIVVLLLLIRVRRLLLVGLEKAWLPEELQHAALVYAEQVFRARSPVPIIAKLDRGYRSTDGVIILVEFKTRRMNRPYLSDVIELSAQRLAVQAQTGECVAHYGYVVIQRSGSKRKMVHRVALLSSEEVTVVAKRREMILLGEVKPQYAGSKGVCNGCAFKLKCSRAAVQEARYMRLPAVAGGKGRHNGAEGAAGE